MIVATNETEVDTQTQLSQFTSCVFDPGDIVEIRVLPLGHSFWCTAAELPNRTAELQQANNTRNGVYVGANPRVAGGGKCDADVSLARCLFADFDDTTLDAVKFRLGETNLPAPTLTIASGHGVHVYFRLGEPKTDLIAWGRWQKDLAALVQSDATICNASRIMRLPGFTNWKSPAGPCVIIESHPDRVYDLVDFHEAIPQREVVADESPVASTNTSIAESDGTSTDTSNRDVLIRARFYADKWPGVGEGSRNAAAVKHAACLRRDFALSNDQAYPILSAWNAHNNPPLGDDELRQCLLNGYEYGKGTIGAIANLKGGSERRLHIVSACNVVAEDIRWTWKNRFAAGKLGLIVGDPGGGKTFVGIDIISRITTGTPWPDDPSIPNPVGDVLFLANEDGLTDTLKPRLDAAKADPKRVHFIRGVRVNNSNDEGMVNLQKDLALIDAELDQHENVRLIVFDPLSNYLGDAETHKDAEVRAVLMPLASLAERRGVAVIGILHLNKSIAAKAIHRTLGSMGFIGVARTVWLVADDLSVDDYTARLLVKIKNNLCADPGALRFRLGPPGSVAYVSWDAGRVDLTADQVLTPSPAKSHRVRDDVIEWLESRLDKGPVLSKTMKDESNQHGYLGRTLARAKRELGVLSRKLPHGDGGAKEWFWVLPRPPAKGDETTTADG